MGRGMWVALEVASFLLGFVLSVSATARSLKAVLPSTTQLSALERASDCGLVRSVKRHFVEVVRVLDEEIDREAIELRAFHYQLTQCAKRNNLKVSTDDPEKEALLATTCESEYERWVSHSYRVMMLEDEKGTAVAKTSEADHHLGECPKVETSLVQGAMYSNDLF